jgi:5,10-methylenetetrahydrofolate reductase
MPEALLRSLPVTLEITPPARERPALLLRRARCLGERPSRVNVIQRPDRWGSLEAALHLQREGLRPVWHLVNRGRSARAVERDLLAARKGGIRRVLCIRGEHKADDAEDTPRIREVVRMARRILPEAEVGVTLNPFVATDARSRARVLANLEAKLSAGARGVQLQLCFDVAALAPFADWVRQRAPQARITAMAMPVLSRDAALRLSRRIGVPLPDGLASRLDRFGSEAGWAHFERQAREIAESPLFDGLALMMPVDPDPLFVKRLCALLGEVRSPGSSD